MKITDKITEF